METVRERLSKAQAAGDLPEIKRTLLEAQAAGADPAMIQQALSEIDRLGTQRSGEGSSGQPAVSPEAAASAAAAAEASQQAKAEAEAARQRVDALKKRGNERLKDGTRSAAKEALDYFTAGLEVRCSDNVLNAQLYSNRAHVHILLHQFVEAVDDCRRAIELDPKSLKAYWRAAKASLHLDLSKNAVEFCDAGLRLEPSDADLLRMRSTCAEKLAGQQQRRAELAAKSEFNAEEAMGVQERVNNLSEQVDIMKASMAQKQRERLKANLTKDVINEVPPESNLYISVGRVFVREDRKVIEEKLSTSLQKLDEELPKMASVAQEMEKRKEAAEKELREMIQAFKQQSS